MDAAVVPDVTDDLRRIRDEVLQKSIEELSAIKIDFDYNSVDVMIRNVIDKHHKHVALTQISALLVSPAFYLLHHPVLSLMTLSASAIWLTYKLNAFSAAIENDLRRFGNDLSEETFNAMLIAINKTLQQTNDDVIKALDPIIVWNETQYKAIQEQEMQIKEPVATINWKKEKTHEK
eukprot:704569_1